MKFSILERPDVHDDLKRLARHCAALAGTQEMALWQMFRPQDVLWMLGRLYVVEVLEGGADFYFRLSGMQLKDIYGTELESVRLSAYPNDPMREVLFRNYRGIVESGEPLFQKAILRWKQGYDVHVQRLLIPFAGTDGAVHTILGGIYSDVPDDLLVLYRDNSPVMFQIEE